MTAVQHRDHAHRAHARFALAVGWAAAVAVAVGVASGALLALAVVADLQALAVGSGYGLIPGVLAAIGVVVARRELTHGVPYRRAVSIVVLSVACATGLLYALTQMAIELAPVGVLLGAWTSLVATCIGLLRSRR